MGKEHHNTIRLAAGYGLSILLIPIYVNMFGVWKLLNALLGEFFMLILPIAVTGAALAAVLFFTVGKSRKVPKARLRTSIIFGTAICLLALTIPDPLFPVKRIHVAEYLLLSLVVRYAMSHKLHGLPLLIFSAMFATLLGIHDEFLQGLHPARTYGLRDMCVNGLSAWGGALIWHGLDLFTNIRQDLPAPRPSGSSAVPLYLCWLIAGVAALIIPLAWYRGFELPLWPAMPLLAGIVLYSLYENELGGTWKHGITATSVLSFSLLLYPVSTHVAAFTFY